MVSKAVRHGHRGQSILLQLPCADVSCIPSLFLSWGSSSHHQSIGKQRPDCLFQVGKGRGGDTDVPCGLEGTWGQGSPSP